MPQPHVASDPPDKTNVLTDAAGGIDQSDGFVLHPAPSGSCTKRRREEEEASNAGAAEAKVAKVDGEGQEEEGLVDSVSDANGEVLEAHGTPSCQGDGEGRGGDASADLSGGGDA